MAERVLTLALRMTTRVVIRLVMVAYLKFEQDCTDKAFPAPPPSPRPDHGLPPSAEPEGTAVTSDVAMTGEEPPVFVESRHQIQEAGSHLLSWLPWV